MADRACATRRLGWLGPVAALVFLALTAPAACAATDITQFSLVPSTTQAGGHPDIEFRARFAGRIGQVQGSDPCNCHDPASVLTHFPTGVIAIPDAAPACTAVKLSQSQCPPDSQVGIAYGTGVGIVPLFNMIPSPDQVGLLAFENPLIGAPVFTVLSTRTGSDYGLDARSSGVSHLVPLTSLSYTLWGVPAAPAHDSLRFPIAPDPCPGPYPDASSCFTPTPASTPPAPFIENPTSCEAVLSASLEVRYYDLSTAQASTSWPASTHCDQLSFNPSLTAQPTTRAADTPSGIDLDLSVPQGQSAETPSPSEIRAATISLPAGFAIDPHGLDGKSACTDSQAGLGTENAAACPEASKVGTLGLDSSALPGPIGGAIYLAGRQSTDDRYGLFLTADGYATHVKLAGAIDADPFDGRLQISLPELPQNPLQAISMHFFGSERGLFVTPIHCDTYPVSTEFVPWDSALGDQVSQTSFTIDSGPAGAPCPGSVLPFSPRFKAGSVSYAPGLPTSFGFELSRGDGEQGLSGLSLALPPGFVTTLKGVPPCSLPAPCPAESRIGTAVAALGEGGHPLYLRGAVYLAGPYKGAPFSVVMSLPALAGPYALGEVTVRAAVRVDPLSAQISAYADPLPQILGGIPLRARFLRVELDRPGFVLNPTNCGPLSVDVGLSGDRGAVATRRAHFQLADCAKLGFAPKLALRLRGATKRGGRPALRARLTALPGNANLSSATLTLPPAERLDRARVGASCTTRQLDAGQCPGDSVLGTATVVTPLLDAPLSGNVFLLSGGGRTPEVAVALRGRVAIDLRGRIDAVKGGLRISLGALPDLPITSLELDLLGGGQGLIVNHANLCRVPSEALATLAAQNGKRANLRTALHPSCATTARQGRARELEGK